MSVKKNYTAEEKARIALEALRGNMTYNEISSKYQVHSTQINRWKTIARNALVNGFKDNTKPKLQDDILVDELYKQIGQLKVELEWLKKNLPCSLTSKRLLVEANNTDISVNRQLELLGINKSSYYYKRVPICAETLELLSLIDRIYTDYPTFGTRSMCSYLLNEYGRTISSLISYKTLILFYYCINRESLSFAEITH